MIDYILVGLITGVVFFISLFIVSFVTLGMITGCIRLIAAIFRFLLYGHAPAYREEAA